MAKFSDHSPSSYKDIFNVQGEAIFYDGIKFTFQISFKEENYHLKLKFTLDKNC